MNVAELHTAQVVTLHPDAIVRAGVVASLRQHTAFHILETDHDAIPTALAGTVSVVVAEHAQAMRMAEAAARTQAGARALPRILVLTTNDREADIRRAIEAGIDGYILLNGPLHDLVDGVKTLASGGRYLSRTVAQRMAESVTRATLTSREFDVLQHAAVGESNKVIARHLGIEIGTVKSHMNAIMGKLNATSRTQVAAIAVTEGLVEARGLLPRPVAPRPHARGNSLVLTN